MRLRLKTPLSPYSQPSGPQVSELGSSCVSCAAEAGNHDFAPVGAAVAVGILHEEDVGRVRHPHAAMADGNA